MVFSSLIIFVETNQQEELLVLFFSSLSHNTVLANSATCTSRKAPCIQSIHASIQASFSGPSLFILPRQCPLTFCTNYISLMVKEHRFQTGLRTVWTLLPLNMYGHVPTADLEDNISTKSFYLLSNISDKLTGAITMR